MFRTPYTNAAIYHHRVCYTARFNGSSCVVIRFQIYYNLGKVRGLNQANEPFALIGHHFYVASFVKAIYIDATHARGKVLES